MKEEKHILHNLTQAVLLPLLITFFSLSIFPSLKIEDTLAVAVFGSLFPDIDHINIWFEYKFDSFKSFIKFLTKARRYRYSFLIFHNIAAMAVVILLIPLVSNIEPLGGIFLVAFLLHLLLDFIDDRISIGRVRHWRYRRKT